MLGLCLEAIAFAEVNTEIMLFSRPCVSDALLGSICVQSVFNKGGNPPGDCGCSNSSSADEGESIHDAQLNMGTKKAPPFGRARVI